MKPLRKRTFLTLFILAAVFTLLVSTSAVANVDKMTKEELIKNMGEENVLILDVRTGRDWSSSEFKIKGADRTAPQDFQSWSNKYPKDKTLVLYCA
jgi:hypothetical protein